MLYRNAQNLVPIDWRSHTSARKCPKPSWESRRQDTVRDDSSGGCWSNHTPLCRQQNLKRSSSCMITVIQSVQKPSRNGNEPNNCYRSLRHRKNQKRWSRCIETGAVRECEDMETGKFHLSTSHIIVHAQCATKFSCEVTRTMLQGRASRYNKD